MKTICLLFMLAACLAVVCAAPAGQAPTVNLLKYNNDQELEAIMRQIIAQYEQQYGGTSQFHQPQAVSYTNPHQLTINL
ncbi:uncharacterized protein LOC115621039 [Scaptodrosophila lebanonensis]|uniref:Uncharacterized protein LOC115621039 n=1 Tax=Drosophila lebanonensis TaxID=7225 RepID=A0A6J2T0K2_DROLE|nr:uncharacterized protein LOC115621039 [Scaptodrosophila lebanonensis]